jgi:hypothetical protein
MRRVGKAFSLVLGAALPAAACGPETRVGPALACSFAPVAAAQATPPSGAAIAPELPGSMTLLPLDTVSMTDPAITNKVLVQQVVASRSATGTVAVTTRFANCTDFPLQLEGRTHFLAADQSPAEPVSAWKRVFLPARSLGTYSENSLQVEPVAHYLIEVREGV